MALSVSNAEAFAIHIEHVVKTRKLGYMEAVVEYCNERDLEPETIVPFLSDKIKHGIAIEASRLHLLHPSAELPFDEA
jgi:hypothetical protein